jgi:hypothetical protein
MGKHDEIWQSINDLDDRVTRLEERAMFPQVEIPTATPQPRPWQIKDKPVKITLTISYQ